MKFFHLADLHLGKCIHGYSMIEMGDQPFWIDQLLKKAEELKPDAVVIAGDVYDRAVPSKEAVDLLDQMLTRLSKLQIPVLLTAGNHDSGTRLAFGDQLLRPQGIYIAGRVQSTLSCVTLQDAYGPVHFWLVPYLFPAAANVILNREDIKDYDTAMRELLNRQQISFEDRNVMVAHQFVVAGENKPMMGGSETTVGGIGQIDAEVFEKFDYTALGHIHKAQRMGRENVRYAGAPLSYHFSEVGQKKGLTIVELKEKGTIDIRVEKLPVLHEMCEVFGTMEELLQMKVKKNSYLRAVIRQETLPPQAVDMLRSYYEEQDCVLMEVVRDVSSYKKRQNREDVEDVRELSLEELFTKFYKEQNGGNLPEQTLNALISFVAEQVRNGCEDESESERKQGMKKLIDFAIKTQYREDEE